MPGKINGNSLDTGPKVFIQVTGTGYKCILVFPPTISQILQAIKQKIYNILKLNCVSILQDYSL